MKTYIDETGYRKFSDSHIYVHRWVAEKFILDRKLHDWEVIHHLDGDKTNNKPYNLKVCTREEHQRIHEKNKIYTGSWSYPEFIFPIS